MASYGGEGGNSKLMPPPYALCNGGAELSERPYGDGDEEYEYEGPNSSAVAAVPTMMVAQHDVVGAHHHHRQQSPSSLDSPPLSRSTSFANIQEWGKSTPRLLSAGGAAMSKSPPPVLLRMLTPFTTGDYEEEEPAAATKKKNENRKKAAGIPAQPQYTCSSSSSFSSASAAALCTLWPLPRCEILEWTHMCGAAHLDVGSIVTGLDLFLRRGKELDCEEEEEEEKDSGGSHHHHHHPICVQAYNPFKFRWRCWVDDPYATGGGEDGQRRLYFTVRLFRSGADDDLPVPTTSCRGIYEDEEEEDELEPGSRHISRVQEEEEEEDKSGNEQQPGHTQTTYRQDDIEKNEEGCCIVEFQRGSSGSAFTYAEVFKTARLYMVRHRLCTAWNADDCSRRRAQSLRRATAAAHQHNTSCVN